MFSNKVKKNSCLKFAIQSSVAFSKWHAGFARCQAGKLHLKVDLQISYERTTGGHEILMPKLLLDSHSDSSEASGCFVKKYTFGIAMVVINLPGTKLNTIGRSFFDEIPPIVKRLEEDPMVKVIIFASGKEGDFIAGADINMITELVKKGREAVKSEGCHLIHALFEKFEQGKPKVVAINGTCLGGGLEFALACHYRIATDNSSTSFGLPEVMLGLLPGGGGTQRLPRLIGIHRALPMLLSGGIKKSRQAMSIGLIDEICPKQQLEACALRAAERIASGVLKIRRPQPHGIARYLDAAIRHLPFIGDYVLNQAKITVMKQSGGHYPAPLKIIDLVRASLRCKVLATQTGFAMEADAFADLAMTPTSEGLKAVFGGQTALKKNPFPDPSLVESIGVVGAGFMGTAITEVSLLRGFQVALQDTSSKITTRAHRRINANFGQRVNKQSMSERDKLACLSNLMVLEGGSAKDSVNQMGNFDLVIEVVSEDLDLKQRVVESLEKVVASHCIMATATSSLSIADIAKSSKRPENVIGMHYFSSADQARLVEIIPHAGTSGKVLATAVQVALKQGKLPVVCKDVPGFYVNRCLAPYLDESIAIAFELENYLELDRAVKGFGFQTGPIGHIDEMGLDAVLSIYARMREECKERMSGADVLAVHAVRAAGIKGKRFGCGFLCYPADRGALGQLAGLFGARSSVSPNPVAKAAMKPFMRPGKVSFEDIQTRVVSRFLNEAARCLQDGVIRNAVDGDMAAIFGAEVFAGFPAFTGGPFRHMDALGAAALVDRLKQLEGAHGPRFRPAQLLVDMAKDGRRFHND